MTRVKVGKAYSIPDLRLYPIIYNDVKSIYDNYRLEEAKDEDTVAKLLKHKGASGGAWSGKLADMRMYGLLEPRGIKLTPIAERMCYGTPDSIQQAINEAILNVPLWKELYSRFTTKLSDSEFWVQLQKITGQVSKDAQDVAESVKKAYLEDISHFKAENKPSGEGSGKTSGQIDKNVITTIDAQADIVRGLIVQGAFKIAKEFIDFIESKSKEEKPKEET